MTADLPTAIDSAHADHGAVDGERVPVRLPPVGRLPVWFQSGGQLWIWLGLVVTLVGFVLIAVCWGQVAGETQVYRQLPYVVSAGLVGLGLVIVGITAVNIASRNRDAVDRDRQIDRLVAIMEELSKTLADRDEP